MCAADWIKSFGNETRWCWYREERSVFYRKIIDPAARTEKTPTYGKVFGISTRTMMFCVPLAAVVIVSRRQFGIPSMKFMAAGNEVNGGVLIEFWSCKQCNAVSCPSRVSDVKYRHPTSVAPNRVEKCNQKWTRLLVSADVIYDDNPPSPPLDAAQFPSNIVLDYSRIKCRTMMTLWRETRRRRKRNCFKLHSWAQDGLLSNNGSSFGWSEKKSCSEHQFNDALLINVPLHQFSFLRLHCESHSARRFSLCFVDSLLHDVVSQLNLFFLRHHY